MATVLAPDIASACVPPALLSSTLKAAAALATGQAAVGAVSSEVAALMHGTLKSMLLAKLKVTTAVLLTVATLGGSAGGYAYHLTSKAAAPSEANGSSLQPDTRIAAIPIAEPPPARPKKVAAKSDDTVDIIQADKKRLQGGWLPVKAVINGRPTDPSDKKIRRSELTFNEDEAALWDAKGPYTLDPARKPKQLDIVLHIKGHKEPIKAIYDFDGDQLLLSWIDGRERPPDFDAGKREGVFIVYEKMKR